MNTAKQKKGLRTALIARGRRLKPVTEALDVSRAQLSLYRSRSEAWSEGRKRRCQNGYVLLALIRAEISDLPSYGYRRVWALLRRRSEQEHRPVVNAKRVMHENNLLVMKKAQPAADAR